MFRLVRPVKPAEFGVHDRSWTVEPIEDGAVKSRQEVSCLDVDVLIFNRDRGMSDCAHSLGSLNRLRMLLLLGEKLQQQLIYF